MKIVRFELTDQEETMFYNAIAMQEFYSVTPKIFFMMCVARALDGANQEKQLSRRKSNATPMQEVTKNLPETNSIPTQPVYKLPVYKSYTPEEVIQLEAEMQALFDA